MRTLITAATAFASALVLAGGAGELQAQADGLAEFPAVYRVQFENAWVRLVRVRVAGRTNLGMHSHPAGFMVHVYLSDADPILFSHDGPPYDITRPAVTARSYRIGTATPEIHAVSNPFAGHTDYQRVEYKTTGFESSRERVFAPPLALTSSAVVEHAAEMSRVTRLTIAAGASVEVAATATEPALLIFVTDGMLAEEAGIERRTVKTGDERFVNAGSRSVVHNAGTTPLQVLRFDFLTPPARPQ